VSKQKMKSRVGNEEEDIFNRLSAGLSRGEIQRVLAGALKSLDHAGVDRLLKRVGAETGAALRRALGAGNSKQRPAPGRAKIKEEWQQARDGWDHLISEASDSEGQYVIQEHHWEEPYFDPQSVAYDLEPIAARVRKLLPRVFEENIDPDFSFSQAIQQSIEEIESSLPDWMHPFENEGFQLGPEVTACLIDWEWRSARQRGMTAFPFVDELLELEAVTQGLSLDEKVLARFIRRLDEEAKSEVQKGIQKKRNQSPWKQALESAYSSWFRIYSELCRRQDPSGYLEGCRARISQDWTLALPVAKDLERKKKYAQAEALCAAALRSFLRLPEGEKWELRKDLLAGSYRTNGEGNASLQNLLQMWGRSARALQEEEVAVAARLQADLLKDWRNWDKAIAAFRCIPQSGFSALRECLFARWRELVATRSVDSDADRPEKPHWVHALADAAREGEGAEHSISAWLRQWLQAIERDGATLRRSEAALVRLSLDLNRAQWLSRISPTMVRLLADNRSSDRTLDASRKKWLKRLGISSLVPELLAFWRRNPRHLVEPSVVRRPASSVVGHAPPAEELVASTPGKRIIDVFRESSIVANNM
jgi:hypothetical protein